MMSKLHTWEVSDEFWHRAEALLPVRQRPEGKIYQRQPGAGGKNARKARPSLTRKRGDVWSRWHIAGSTDSANY
jgi:hypothetical protein